MLRLTEETDDSILIEPVRAPTIFATGVATTRLENGCIHMTLTNEMDRADGSGVDRVVVLRLTMPVDFERKASVVIERAYANTPESRRRSLM